MSGAEEIRAIAQHVRVLYPDQWWRLLRLADEHQRMSEALDGLVQLSRDVMRAREPVSA